MKTMEKPRKWTWEEWCEYQYDSVFEKLQCPPHEKNAFHANTPYIEAVEFNVMRLKDKVEWLGSFNESLQRRPGNAKSEAAIQFETRISELESSNSKMEAQKETIKKDKFHIKKLEKELESYKTKSQFKRLDIQMKGRIKELEAENGRLSNSLSAQMASYISACEQNGAWLEKTKKLEARIKATQESWEKDKAKQAEWVDSFVDQETAKTEKLEAKIREFEGDSYIVNKGCNDPDCTYVYCAKAREAIAEDDKHETK